MEQEVYHEIMSLPQGINYHLPFRRDHASAVFLEREIFKNSRYARSGFAIRETDTIVDIGANMGFFSIWAAQQARKGIVLAIEPVKDSIDLMQLNIEKNKIKNIRPVHAAVGIGDNHLEIVKYPGFNPINHTSENKPPLAIKILVGFFTRQSRYKTVVEKIDTISLDHLIKKNHLHRIDYLKLDCEGGEFEILRTLSDESFARIKKIAMEFHEYKPENRHRELIEILESKGFEVMVEKPLLSYYVNKLGFIWARK